MVGGGGGGSGKFDIQLCLALQLCRSLTVDTWCEGPGQEGVTDLAASYPVRLPRGGP